MFIGVVIATQRRHYVIHLATVFVGTGMCSQKSFTGGCTSTSHLNARKLWTNSMRALSRYAGTNFQGLKYSNWNCINRYNWLIPKQTKRFGHPLLPFISFITSGNMRQQLLGIASADCQKEALRCSYRHFCKYHSLLNKYDNNLETAWQFFWKFGILQNNWSSFDMARWLKSLK